MADGDIGKAIFKEIQQPRTRGHARQGRIVAHHENRARTQAREYGAFRIGLGGAHPGHGRGHNQALKPCLGVLGGRGLLACCGAAHSVLLAQ
jgi:hypothetical protein